MGNNISNFTDIAAIGNYVSELGDVSFEKKYAMNQSACIVSSVMLIFYATC